MFNQNDIDTLIQIIPDERQSAITAREIAQNLGYPVVGNQEKTRDLIRLAIECENIILSSSNQAPRGYWISTDRQEVTRYINSLESRANENIQRSTNLKDAWNNNNPNNQIQ